MSFKAFILTWATVSTLAFGWITVDLSDRVTKLEVEVKVLHEQNCLNDRDLYYTWLALDDAGVHVRELMEDIDDHCRRP